MPPRTKPRHNMLYTGLLETWQENEAGEEANLATILLTHIGIIHSWHTEPVAGVPSASVGA